MDEFQKLLCMTERHETTYFYFFLTFSALVIFCPFKRPCRYIFTHFRYTFSDPHFLVLSIDLELKPHGKLIQSGFWAQNEGFWPFQIFFPENHGFSVQKRKKKIYLYFLYSNVPKLIPDIVCNYFYYTSPPKHVKTVKTVKFWVI